ncbi:MAG: flagellar biosynthesis protein FliQ [Deltaproteobacteria bacterium]|jgi:flagellar biosynthetic protein FliQ
MTPEFVTGFFLEAMKTAALLSMPVLLVGLIAGVLVSVFQAATQINEMTLVLIPKMIAVGIALIIFFPWMMELMVDFTRNIIVNLPITVR